MPLETRSPSFGSMAVLDGLGKGLGPLPANPLTLRFASIPGASPRSFPLKGRLTSDILSARLPNG